MLKVDGQAKVRTSQAGSRQAPASPPAVWAAFVAQGRWRSWTIVALLGLVGLQSLAIIRLATRPPEVVLVDGAGHATPVRHSVASAALLRFVAEQTRPPEVAVVRFTRDFLSLVVGVNSSTVEASWPAALALMAPDLRARIEAESARSRLVQTWRLAQRKTDLHFEEIALEQQTPSLLSIRTVLRRRVGPLLDGAGPSSTDRVQVDLVARIVTPTMDRPDGLEVAEWRLTPLPVTDSSSTPGDAAKGVTDGP